MTDDPSMAWQVTGGCLLAPILVTVLVTARLQEWDIPTYTWLLWLQLPIFMLHEFEEYVLPGGFKSFFNHDTVFASPEPGNNTPLSDGYVFFVNIVTILVVTVAVYVALRYRRETIRRYATTTRADA